jgi:hypothetical protein
MKRPWLSALAVAPVSAIAGAACQSLDLRIVPAEAATGADAIHGDAGGPEAEASDATTHPDGATHLDAAVDAGSDGGLDCDASDATICDNFNRTVVIPSGDTRWDDVTCDAEAGASLKVDGTMNVAYPAGTGGSCYLNSFKSQLLGHPIASIGSFKVDFDLNFDSTSSTVTTVLLDILVYPTTGSDQEIVQLLLGGDGSGQLYVLFQSDGYKPHLLGYLYTPAVWVPPRSSCHISVDFDVTVPSGTATSTCLGVAQELTKMPGAVPAGFAGAATLSLGYSIDMGPGIPAWSLAFDNFEFRASP